MLVDISERKKAEEYAGRLAAIVEFSDDAIVSKNIDGIIQTWNRGARTIFSGMKRKRSSAGPSAF